MAKVTSKFVRIMKLAAKYGTKQKTTIRQKTEEGSITLSVDGGTAVTAAEFNKLAAASGAKFAGKGGEFGECDGSQGMSLDGKSAAIIANEMMGKDDAGDEEGDEDDTDTEPAKDKAGAAD